MTKVEKEIKYFDDNGEMLIEPIEVVKMTPELETKLEKAIGLVQECGYFIHSADELKLKSQIDYALSNRIYGKLFIIVMQLLVSGIVLFQGYYSFLYLLLAFTLALVISVFLDIKKVS